MTNTDSEVETLRMRLDLFDRRLRQVEAQLSWWSPPSEPVPFPVRHQTTPRLESKYYCSFCGKGQKEVASLIAGPGPFICSECVDLCHEIVEEKRTKLSESKL